MQYNLSTFRNKSPFINCLREKMRGHRLSPRTETAYIGWIVDFVAWTGFAKPDVLTGQHVTDYLSMLARERKVARSTQNQAFNALLFLFVRGLERELGSIKAERSTIQPRPPEFITRDEFKAILTHLQGDSKTLALLAFGTGLRLMELLRLRVKDIDFSAKLIRVHDGKHGNNRVVPLPASLVTVLQRKIKWTAALHQRDLEAGYGSVWLPDGLAAKYPKAAKELKWQWLFPSPEICKADDGTLRRHHQFPNTFQTALRKAGESASLTKRVHPHALRHGHATALLEMGRSLDEVRQRLGHRDIKTTQVYLHCVTIGNAPNPVDCLCDH